MVALFLLTELHLSFGFRSATIYTKCFGRGLHHGHCRSYLCRHCRAHSDWGIKWWYCTEGNEGSCDIHFYFFTGLLLVL
jgi:hypothetical protein